jgi:hypothetical protein
MNTIADLGLSGPSSNATRKLAIYPGVCAKALREQTMLEYFLCIKTNYWLCEACKKFFFRAWDPLGASNTRSKSHEHLRIIMIVSHRSWQWWVHGKRIKHT